MGGVGGMANINRCWAVCVPYLTGVRTRGPGKSLARPGRKQATATEEFDVHESYLLS